MLVRFNSVCKHWYDLIRSPNFVTSHYETSLKKKVSIFYYDDVHSLFDSTFDVPVELLDPVRYELLLVGCYNGLVCLSLSDCHDEFFLWNPATAQSRIIPITALTHITYAQYYSGLCFDSAANTHKILRIRFFLKYNAKFIPKGKVFVFAYVYTLNDDSWRKERLFALCRLPNGGDMSKVTHLMRFMCWMVSSDKDKYILCLDMVDEEFKLIELPCSDHIHCGTQLVDYKGSLAMFVRENSASGSHGVHRCFDLWVLNDCGGANQSWCKQLTLRPPMTDVKPLGFFINGDVDFVILCTSTDECLLWDEDTGETNNGILGKYWDGPSFVYSESFASVY